MGPGSRRGDAAVRLAAGTAIRHRYLTRSPPIGKLRSAGPSHRGGPRPRPVARSSPPDEERAAEILVDRGEPEPAPRTRLPPVALQAVGRRHILKPVGSFEPDRRSIPGSRRGGVGWVGFGPRYRWAWWAWSRWAAPYRAWDHLRSRAERRGGAAGSRGRAIGPGPGPAGPALGAAAGGRRGPLLPRRLRQKLGDERAAVAAWSGIADGRRSPAWRPCAWRDGPCGVTGSPRPRR